MTTLDEAVQELQLVEVFAVEGGCGYDWNDFRAWRAPSGRFFWFEDAGCSCSCYGDGFRAVADFSDGDRGALESAFREWSGEGDKAGTAQEVIDGLEKLRRL